MNSEQRTANTEMRTANYAQVWAWLGCARKGHRVGRCILRRSPAHTLLSTQRNRVVARGPGQHIFSLCVAENRLSRDLNAAVVRTRGLQATINKPSASFCKRNLVHGFFHALSLLNCG